MIASGGAANSLRICQIQHCYTLIDESTFYAQSINGLTEIARDMNANIYSLIYAVDFVETAGGGDVIRWLQSSAGNLSEQFGYKNLNKGEQ